jgi:heme-degrading monooxygenase HmoA
MVVTLLEGVVEKHRTRELEDAYREIASDLPEILIETFLVRDVGDEASFGILTVWSSMEAVQAMRQQAEAEGSKPKGVLVFESVGVTPTLRVFDVLHHGS